MRKKPLLPAPAAAVVILLLLLLHASGAVHAVCPLSAGRAKAAAATVAQAQGGPPEDCDSLPALPKDAIAPVALINAGGPAMCGFWTADTEDTPAAAAAGTGSKVESWVQARPQHCPTQRTTCTIRFGPSFGYSVPTHPGASYRVRLTLAEVWWTAPGKRLFDITLNGAPKLAGLDLFALAGAQFVPVTQEFDFVAAGLSSDIGFTAQLDNAAVAAIEVYELNVPRVMHAPVAQPAPPQRRLLQQLGEAGDMTYEEWDALDRLDPVALTDSDDDDDKEIEPPSITGHEDEAALRAHGHSRGSTAACLRSDGRPCSAHGGAGASFARGSGRMREPVLAALIRDEQEHLHHLAASSSAGRGSSGLSTGAHAAARLLAAMLAAAALLLVL